MGPDGKNSLHRLRTRGPDSQYGGCYGTAARDAPSALGFLCFGPAALLCRRHLGPGFCGEDTGFLYGCRSCLPGASPPTLPSAGQCLQSIACLFEGMNLGFYRCENCVYLHAAILTRYTHHKHRNIAQATKESNLFSPRPRVATHTRKVDSDKNCRSRDHRKDTVPGGRHRAA